MHRRTDGFVTTGPPSPLSLSCRVAWRAGIWSTSPRNPDSRRNGHLLPTSPSLRVPGRRRVCAPISSSFAVGPFLPPSPLVGHAIASSARHALSRALSRSSSSFLLRVGRALASFGPWPAGPRRRVEQPTTTTTTTPSPPPRSPFALPSLPCPALPCPPAHSSPHLHSVMARGRVC